MEAQIDLVQIAVLGGSALFVISLIAFFIFALRKAQKRRAQELSETPLEAREVKFKESELQQANLDSSSAIDIQKAKKKQSVETKQEQVVEVTAKPSARKGVTVAPSKPFVESVTSAELDAKAIEALNRGLARTRSTFRERLSHLFSGKDGGEQNIIDQLEEVLLSSDVGVSMTMCLLDAVRDELKNSRLKTQSDIQNMLQKQMLKAFSDTTASNNDPLAYSGNKPRVILFVGVNGVGKTTTIGKIAAKAKARGLDVVLGAGDTFRAAATEQLAIWADRTQSRIIKGDTNADPASVIYNTIQHAVQSKADLVLADTAGRLHTKTALMDEIKKVKRSVAKAKAEAPDEIWLVVDATTGQNALQQAREFHQALNLTGVILTKLDGTAKGGVVVAIADALSLPVCYIGVGEKAEDLQPFAAGAFVTAMFS
ncbi:MAG: signal recognition particle-docking protein FtsY [Deltaproteobacteria bacterium]|nr:signal recognition particle-docking protein FtsY [Deltaproteobacteria bacterium]